MTDAGTPRAEQEAMRLALAAIRRWMREPAVDDEAMHLRNRALVALENATGDVSELSRYIRDRLEQAREV